MCSRFAFIVLLLCWVNWSEAQNIVSGRVVDSLTNEPVAFATVYLDGTTVGTTTDDDGRFSLDVNPRYLPATIIVSHLNYAAWRGRLSTMAT